MKVEKSKVTLAKDGASQYTDLGLLVTAMLLNGRSLKNITKAVNAGYDLYKTNGIEKRISVEVEK